MTTRLNKRINCKKVFLSNRTEVSFEDDKSTEKDVILCTIRTFYIILVESSAADLLRKDSTKEGWKTWNVFDCSSSRFLWQINDEEIQGKVYIWFNMSSTEAYEFKIFKIGKQGFIPEKWCSDHTYLQYKDFVFISKQIESKSCVI